MQARPLGEDEIHLWWLPWEHGMGRAPLQRVLAPYLGVEADTITFESGAHGKPRLGRPFQHLRFNWSHCTGTALLAIARDIELGVDVEQRDRRTRTLGIARRWFAPTEVALLEAQDAATRARTFLALWTVKEAVLKARGENLAFGLKRVVVNIEAGGPRLREVAGRDAAGTAWQLQHPSAPVPGLVSALAWQGSARTLRSFDHTGTRCPSPVSVPS